MTDQIRFIACFATQVGVCTGIIAIVTGSPIFYCAGFTCIIVGLGATFICLSRD